MMTEKDDGISDKIRDFVDTIFWSADDWISCSVHPWYTEMMSGLVGRWEKLDPRVQVLAMVMSTLFMGLGIVRGVQLVRGGSNKSSG